jgi:hypothetical protein
MEFKIGVETITSYKRLSYSPWHAIAEFVDNSTQAYFDNKEILDKAFTKEETNLTVNVLYDHLHKTLTVSDNSIGMDMDDVDMALQVGAKSPRSTGRCKYGMGMKTSACWFGDQWEIKTKKLGETKEITVSIDVNKIASGEAKLAPKLIDTGDPETHYTELTIRELHKKLPSRTLSKISRFLSSMYRWDIKQGLLELYFQNSPLSWEDLNDRILKTAEGIPYIKTLDFNVLGHQITGWVAVLGSGSRELAGFTILQNNRVIRGYPESWRPEPIYGQVQGSNDLINQRLVGEVNLDGFDVSHTKDDIVWAGEEEEEIENALYNQCRDYRTVAALPYKGRDERQPSEAAIDAAVDQVVRDLKSDQIVDHIAFTDTETPPEEVVDNTFQAVVDQEKNKTPRIDMQVGKRRILLHLSYDASINDPYVANDITPDEVIKVIVNMNHPYVKFVEEPSAMTNYLRQCIFDAMSTDMARVQKGRVHYNTFQLHKDRLLRIPDQIHDLEPEFLKEDDLDGNHPK